MRPLSPQALLDHLAALGIRTETVEHPPLFTVDGVAARRGAIPGAHTKNLFLKDKKDRVLPRHRPRTRPRST